MVSSSAIFVSVKNCQVGENWAERTQVELSPNSALRILDTSHQAVRVGSIERMNLLSNVAACLRRIYTASVLLHEVVQIQEGVVDKTLGQPRVIFRRVVCRAPDA